MEDFAFDINDLVSGEEADKLFETIQDPPQEENQEAETEQKKETQPAEVPDDKESEKVGEEEKNDDDEKGKGAPSDDGGSSPDTFYSSIANALKTDGIFPDFDAKDIEAVKTADDFADLMEKAVSSRLDERMRRIDEALNDGVAPDTIRQYEQTLQYLGNITEEALSAEGEEGENLRKQLIYNDLINKGFSQEKANRTIEKFFNSGDDLDEAKDALEALTKFYTDGYNAERQKAKTAADEARRQQKENSEKFRKMVLDDEIKLGKTALDKKTCQKVFDAVSKPVWKDPETGRLLTAVQKFQKEQPLEFLKQLGMWFVLTNGGKDSDGFTKEQVRQEKNKSIRDLERKINSTAFDADGALQYYRGTGDKGDQLLSDGWQIDMNG